jgi:UDP-N-acetylmuramoyl-L-alanyl-D-glutamate--2,6-diaminopimelate ligase
LDDANCDYFLKFPCEKKIGFTLLPTRKSNIQTIRGEREEVLPSGSKFFVEGREISINLLGKFNIYNALAAIGVAASMGINLEICRKALAKITVIPGRMEQVVQEPFKVFVDYAFTPNALEKVYQSIRNNFSPSKIVCVLGSCGGGRDKWKRSLLGQIALKYCDEIIVTNEDPYDEDPREIINQVAKGSGPKAIKILDRREAIREALKMAIPDCCVILTGKGCEPWICEKGGKKTPWDEKGVVLEELSKLKNN